MAAQPHEIISNNLEVNAAELKRYDIIPKLLDQVLIMHKAETITFWEAVLRGQSLCDIKPACGIEFIPRSYALALPWQTCPTRRGVPAAPAHMQHSVTAHSSLPCRSCGGASTSYHSQQAVVHAHCWIHRSGPAPACLLARCPTWQQSGLELQQQQPRHARSRLQVVSAAAGRPAALPDDYRQQSSNGGSRTPPSALQPLLTFVQDQFLPLALLTGMTFGCALDTAVPQPLLSSDKPLFARGRSV